MVEGVFGKPPSDFESEGLPEADGSGVGADDEVELHGAEAALPGVGEGVEAHGAGDSSALGGGGGGVAAVGDVGTAALLISGASNRTFLKK